MIRAYLRRSTSHFRFGFLLFPERDRDPVRPGLLEHGGIERKRIEADPHTGDLIKCRNFRRRQRKERKTFRFAARLRARDLTCRRAESRWKVENPYDPPSKVFPRSPEMDSFETRRRGGGSHQFSAPFSAPRVFISPRRAFCPERVLLAATRMPLVYYLQV
jgi:hypothetical protein